MGNWRQRDRHAIVPWRVAQYILGTKGNANFGGEVREEEKVTHEIQEENVLPDIENEGPLRSSGGMSIGQRSKSQGHRVS